MEIHYRHEWKHELSKVQLMAIRSRISAVTMRDPHTVDGKYLIRSLYFDNPVDKALREKIDGVNKREKFRMRYYNGDTSMVHLEKKSKINGLGSKFSANLTKEQVQAIVDGEIDWMLDSDQELIRELYCKMSYQRLAPMTIVDYTREAYIFAPGNIRITFDYNIRTGMKCTDFLNPDCITVPAGDAPILLEVKWDAYLPSIIKDAIMEPGVQVESFSKYAQCRVYG